MLRRENARKLLLPVLVLIAAVILPTTAANAAPADPAGATGTKSDVQSAATTMAYRKVIYQATIPLKLTPNGASSGVHPNAYPGVCGLAVLLFFQGNTLDGAVTTSCSVQVVQITHQIKIQRGRWYGPEVMATGTYNTYNRYSAGDDLYYNCSHTGTHNFQVLGYGTVITPDGFTYTANAYDEIDNLTC
jgi:hypothetical protein